MAFWNRKKGNPNQAGEAELDLSRLPKHIGIIMDGNGRWARKRGLPRTAGHAAGAEAFRRIANYCRTLGVEYLTTVGTWAFPISPSTPSPRKTGSVPRRRFPP